MTIFAAGNAITIPTSHTESPAKHSSGSSSMAGRSVKPDNGGHVTLPSLRSSIYAGGVAVLAFFSQMQPGSATNATATNYIINQTAEIMLDNITLAAQNAAESLSDSDFNTGAAVGGALGGLAMLGIGIGCYVNHNRNAQMNMLNNEQGETDTLDKDIELSGNTPQTSTTVNAVNAVNTVNTVNTVKTEVETDDGQMTKSEDQSLICEEEQPLSPESESESESDIFETQ
ncbi:hypothetical protein [Endozoicomonas sp.]|uniref:hypothetical protein n=1 Tax=Endozoicomonas sp. TaxID=1892382 RepID=UPI00383A2E9E